MRDEAGEGSAGTRYDVDARAGRPCVEGSRDCPIEDPPRIPAGTVTASTARTDPTLACHDRVLYTVLEVPAQQDRRGLIQIKKYNVLLKTIR